MMERRSRGPARHWAFGLALCLTLGCGLTPRVEETVSIGHTSNGYLWRGRALADEGEGFVRARPGESTRFGTAETLVAIEEAAAAVVRRYPGSFPLRVGDLSWPSGGEHPRHRSHRSGRDVDVIFYATDAFGRSVQGRGWLAYDRFGTARETRTPSGSGSGQVFFFDEARNWEFVRTLLMGDHRVQWIFCSRGVKARLLEYAMAHEEDPEAIFRASWALHQPSRGNPHADHFHIRFACTPEQLALGCQDIGYLWPWMRQAIDKPAFGQPTPPLDDAALVHALLSEDGSLAQRVD